MLNILLLLVAAEEVELAAVVVAVVLVDTEPHQDLLCHLVRQLQLLLVLALLALLLGMELTPQMAVTLYLVQ
jgi:hypothetical protein